MSVKIVFIGHDASRTGAPIVLLHLLKWLKNNTDIQLIILLKGGGELEEEFRVLGETHVWEQPAHHANPGFKRRVFNKVIKELSRVNFIKRILNKILRKINIFKHELPQPGNQENITNRLHQFQPDLIYANTVVSSDLGVSLSKSLNCPSICHVHELEVAINRYFGKENFARVRHEVDYYIAVSNAVMKNLLVNHAILDSKINKINAFIPAVEYAAQNKGADLLKEKLGIPKDALIVGGCGTTDWRKSPDLFVQIAHLAMKKNKDQKVYFVWVGGGGDTSSYEYNQLMYDVEKLGLKNILFLGMKNDPLEYFKMFDIFLLSSREDPYPLVCLEAAALSKPILCFDQAGGMPEFVEEDCGFVAPYLDVEFMANALSQLINNKTLREQLGANAYKKVTEQHDIAISSLKISEFVLKVIDENKRVKA